MCKGCSKANTGGADGICDFVKAGTDPYNDCVVDEACDGAGDCKQVSGQSCSAVTGCISGYCPADDGVCCNVACTGVCKACSKVKTGAAEGTCAFIEVGTDPDSECPAISVCDGAGNCL